MPQIFRHSTNYLARTTIYGAIFILVAALFVAAEITRSGWNTGQYIERQQPIQFSHKHHVGDDGIDCRYCHTSVETAASAGMPSTAVCMNCHKQIWADSLYLEPVRASFKTGKPLEWVRVHDHRKINHPLPHVVLTRLTGAASKNSPTHLSSKNLFVANFRSTPKNGTIPSSVARF